MTPASVQIAGTSGVMSAASTLLLSLGPRSAQPGQACWDQHIPGGAQDSSGYGKRSLQVELVVCLCSQMGNKTEQVTEHIQQLLLSSNDYVDMF